VRKEFGNILAADSASGQKDPNTGPAPVCLLKTRLGSETTAASL